MPFKSIAQLRWMFANKPKMAKEFAKHTVNYRILPKYVIKKPNTKINKEK